LFLGYRGELNENVWSLSPLFLDYRGELNENVGHYRLCS
jgi:hypothetical protein